MSRNFSSNRAICMGDRARAGVGESGVDAKAIRQRIADWSTSFLKTFLKTCKSDLWRKEVLNLLLVREGTRSDLARLHSKRARRNRRGSIKAQSFGRALRDP